MTRKFIFISLVLVLVFILSDVRVITLLVNEVSRNKGFRVGKNDPCVYVNPITKVRLVVVVDDILCRGSCKATEAFYTALAARFKVQEPTFLTLTRLHNHILWVRYLTH